jgi:hypothetical protein
MGAVLIMKIEEGWMFSTCSVSPSNDPESRSPVMGDAGINPTRQVFITSYSVVVDYFINKGSLLPGFIPGSPHRCIQFWLIAISFNPYDAKES